MMEMDVTIPRAYPIDCTIYTTHAKLYCKLINKHGLTPDK